MNRLENVIQTAVYNSMKEFFNGKVSAIEDEAKEFMLETSQAAGLRGFKELHNEDSITESILEFQSDRAIRKERIKTLTKERDLLIASYKSQLNDVLVDSHRTVNKVIKKHNKVVKHNEQLMREFLNTLDNSENGKELTELLNT